MMLEKAQKNQNFLVGVLALAAALMLTGRHVRAPLQVRPASRHPKIWAENTKTEVNIPLPPPPRDKEQLAESKEKSFSFNIPLVSSVARQFFANKERGTGFFFYILLISGVKRHLFAKKASRLAKTAKFSNQNSYSLEKQSAFEAKSSLCSFLSALCSLNWYFPAISAVKEGGRCPSINKFIATRALNAKGVYENTNKNN
jgi:hypothetical protein